MNQVTALTDDPIQTLGIILDDGSTVQMNLQYIPAQQGWFYSLSYGSWSANLMRIVNSPNLIRKYRNIIPFGIAVTVIDGYEVVYQSDWVSGRCTMYSLNPSDVIAVEQLINKTLPMQLGNFIS